MKRRIPAVGWGIPRVFAPPECAPKYGYIVVCSSCKGVAFYIVGSHESALVPEGIMTHRCLACEHPLVTELASEWGMHRSPYPRWVHGVLHQAGLLADLPS